MEQSLHRDTKLLELFATPRISITVFVVKGSQILLKKSDIWMPPSTHLEKNETIDESVSRILLEQTQLQPITISHGGWSNDIFNEKHILSLYVVVPQFSGEVKEGWEWFSYLELPTPLHTPLESFCTSAQFYKLMATHTTTKEIAYLAAPYAHKDPKVRKERLDRVTQVAGKLLEQGTFVFSPLTHNVAIDAMTKGRGWDKWRTYDLSALLHCDKLILLKLPGWETSIGVQDELKFAKEHSIQISEIDC